MKIADIQKNIATQDNRGTAAPILILLQVKRTYVAHDEFNHGCDTRFVEHLSGDCIRGESWLSIARRLFKQGYSKAEIDGSIMEYQEGHYWETENVFFTDHGYQEHMQMNAHNYRRGEVRSYAIHAFRNPEMKAVLDLINESAGKEQK